MQTLNQHHREIRIRQSSLLNVKPLMYSITHFHLTKQSIKPPGKKRNCKEIIKFFSYTNRLWQGVVFVMHRLSEALNLCSGGILRGFIHPVQLVQTQIQGVLYVLYQLLYLQGNHIKFEKVLKALKNIFSLSAYDFELWTSTHSFMQPKFEQFWKFHLKDFCIVLTVTHQ